MHIRRYGRTSPMARKMGLLGTREPRRLALDCILLKPQTRCILWAKGPTCNSQGQSPWRHDPCPQFKKPQRGALIFGRPTMPQSLSSILIHLVFSTKNREPWIRNAVEAELQAYAPTVLKNAGCPVLAMNGTADHLHTLLHLSRVRSIADLVEELKTSTSKWIKTKGATFRGFHWQTGYAAFSVSQSNVSQVIEYIAEQKEHHRGRSFQDEFRALLARHEIPFDERYVWD